MLHPNLAILETRWPAVAQQVAASPPPDSAYTATRTPRGDVSARWHAVNGDRTTSIWLHSRYDPQKEAARFAAGHARTGADVLYGFGLGYHVEAIAATRPVRVFEANPSLLHLACALRDLRPLFANDNLDLQLLATDDAARIRAVFPESTPGVVHLPSVRTLPHSAQAVMLALHDVAFSHTTDQRTQAARENALRNRAWNAPSADALLRRWSDCDAAVVAGSGPSLDTALPLLTHLPPTWLLLVTGSALRPILGAGAHPHAVAILDPLAFVRAQFEGLDTATIPLLFARYANWEAVAAHTGEKFAYDTTAGPDSGCMLPCGGSVAHVLVSAAHAAGIRRIALVGVDLCYPDDAHHAADTWYGAQRTITRQDGMVRERDVRGRWVSTQINYLRYRDWLAQWAHRHPDTSLYTCSDCGLPIPGVAHTSLEKLVEDQP